MDLQMIDDEIKEVRERYLRRKGNGCSYPDHLTTWVYMTAQEKERAIIRWIHTCGLLPIEEKRILEIGCGAGANLLLLLKLGFLAGNLVGNELLENRAKMARDLLPSAVRILEGDASTLDYERGSFHAVLSFTVFTSILDGGFREKLASHLWTFVKPGGGILLYDFIYNNPGNPDVRGLPIREIRRLFPEGEIKIWRITLAPPVSRVVTRIHPFLYSLFNMIPLLRTHVLCWIQKRRG